MRLKIRNRKNKWEKSNVKGESERQSRKMEEK